ncbi:IS256 family transposase [Actinocrinis puniceicyclus]|uniref:Mutator family transposase n=1 Tax=Actinocrinis puniceicyclus TaxID=977794 RepID=A0A8J7WT37_9ACTN|nr:IS256 family transposase [Actinocrinis puniceicyclus]MBS2967113.1 IS256 family transposase [Actinocrinis puniceicyclus]
MSGADLTDLLDARAIAQLAERARQQAAEGGLKLLGSDGLLQSLTKQIIEAALEAELAEHLADGRDGAQGTATGRRNERNGRRGKKIATEVGPVRVIVPRDRAGSFEPAVVRKCARRTSGIDEIVISLVGKGLTTGEVAAHLKEVFGVETSKETVSAITDRVLEGMHEWRHRPLDLVYPVLIIDAVHVKIRDGAVANRAVYVAIAVTVHGTREILGLWAGDGGEGAKTWQVTLTELRNRGVKDCCIVLCDGLSGLPEAVNRVWPRAIVQRCLIHLQRNSFTYASKRDWPALSRDLKPVLTAPNAQDAEARFLEFAEAWEPKYPAIVKLWTQAWPEVVPYMAFDREIRYLLTSTNAVESLNARLRRAVKASGHFPTELAALKRLYLAILSLDPTGKAPQRWSNRWKPVLNAFEMAFDGRLHPERDSAAGVKTGDTP